MSRKVGIVIVSYNASVAVRVTLASLRQARNETPAEVLLIDNASNDIEREKIRSAVERHVREASLPWKYIQQERNLGFAGGNNIGIRRFLENPEISHICLLNSDVIVTDQWLDNLVNAQCDMVSSVTNKADSEQCIPVNYNLELDECLDEFAENIPTAILSHVQTFAQDWHTAWAGNLVEADATFFCVLLTKSVFENVGLLDENFFPGGFEDNDYCIRARQLGYRIHLARDVFIHHWGSASFGQLQYGYFNSRAQRNRNYLEKKHGIVWRCGPEKPLISYLMDLRFASTQVGDKTLQRRYNELYTSQLAAKLQYFESEFRNLRRMIASVGKELDEALTAQVDEATSLGDLANGWAGIAREAKAIFEETSRPSISVDDLLCRLELLAEGVRTKVECNFAMHAWLFPPGNETKPSGIAGMAQPGAITPSGAQPGKMKKLLWMLKRSVPFLRNLRGIVFFGGYPYPERLSDGYFQRIQIVDGLFSDRWRVYVENDGYPGCNRWFDRPRSKVLVLRICGGRLRRALVRSVVLIAVLKCRKVYFHSVLRMRDNRFGRLMHMPGLTKVIDIHGVVPEEFRFHNDFFSAVLYEREERLAVQNSNLVIVVTEAMQSYLRQKYREALRGQVAVFPMFASVAPTLAPRARIDGKPVVVYAGGLHKWQQVPKMIDAIIRTVSICVHRFYCPAPDAVRAMLPEAIRAQVIVDQKAHEELIGIYAECHYGFILRDDNVINHVACPTKLVEYLAMGIVPVVDCENIGDFKAMGMQFVTLDDLLQGNLPNEVRRTEMAQQNFLIYERLREARKQGARDIYTLFAGTRKVRDARASVLTRVKRLLPPDTHLGRLARSLQRPLRASTSGVKADISAKGRGSEEPSAQTDASVTRECDVLVQVDNFEAGGLEKVVIDLSETLMSANYKVVLLVLGTAGAGVHWAHERGIPVVIGSSKAESYRALIERLKPRLLLTHYSLHGAELCHERGIPFVQVIHNTYMWFDDAQREAFGRAARLTTVFVAVSEYAKSYSVRRLGVDNDRCIVIPNGIDNKVFDAFDTRQARRDIRARHGLGDQDFVFLSVGSINHQKNHIATVRAFATVAEELRCAKVVILGPVYEQGLLDDIECFVSRWGLSDRVIYAGATSGAQKYYAMADAFVSASFFEGGPLNQLEAIKANLPSIMTDIGFAGYFKGIPGCEIVAPALDIAEFGGAIWQLTSTPAFEKRLAEAMVHIYRNRRRPNLPVGVLDAFDKSNAYQCYVELIGDLLQGKDIRGKNFRSGWLDRLTSAPSEYCHAAG